MKTPTQKTAKRRNGHRTLATTMQALARLEQLETPRCNG